MMKWINKNKFVSVVVFGLILLVNTPLLAAALQSNTSKPNDSDLEISLHQIIEKHQLPSASIALHYPSGESKAFGIGLARVDEGSKATDKTLYRIGSTSKIFVGLAILQLEEKGFLTLEDKVRDLVPEVVFENKWEDDHPIRVYHLLSHTTGWDDFHLSEYRHSKNPPITLLEGLNFRPQSRNARWIPGSRHSYSNSGPAVAAYIVEKLTGMPFEDYIQKEFFDPLGMTTATFFESKTYQERGAHLYSKGQMLPYWHIIMRPTGAINASAEDMSRLLTYLIAPEKQPLISLSQMKKLYTQHGNLYAQNGLETGYTLTHYTAVQKDLLWFGHNGGVSGGASIFSYHAPLGLGYYIAINEGNHEALKEIEALIVEHLVAQVDQNQLDLYRYQSQEDVFVADDSLNELQGYYKTINPRNQNFYFIERLFNIVRVDIEGNKVLIKDMMASESDAVQTYLAVNTNQFVHPSTGKISLVRSQDPLVGEVLLTAWQVFKPVSFLEAYYPLSMVLTLIIASFVMILRYAYLGILLLKKKPLKGQTSHYLFPLAQVIFFIAFAIGLIALSIVSGEGGFEPQPLLKGYLILTSIGYALTTGFSWVALLLKPKPRLSYAIALGYTILSSALVIYLLRYGVIGQGFF